MSEAWIAACNCVLLTKVVARTLLEFVPFHCTTELEVKFDPPTVSVNAAPPVDALEGESEAIAGAGLFTVNELAAERPPPGAGTATCTGAMAASATFAAGTDAVICVELTTVLVSAVPFQ